ncbi:MAG: hypothetical protein ACP5SH_28000 [Syntrophobacteraceae bacterium]
MTELDDFRFVCRILAEFCDQRRIIETLKSIHDLSITDWEKWLQVEIMVFLRTHSDVRSIQKEYRYQCDKRKTYHTNVYADIYFERQYTNRDVGIVLELKTHNHTATCIDRMICDRQKIEKLRTNNIRSFWVVGFHLKDEKSPMVLKQYICNQLNDKHGIKVKQLEIIPIKRTPFAVTIF